MQVARSAGDYVLSSTSNVKSRLRVPGMANLCPNRSAGLNRNPRADFLIVVYLTKGILLTGHPIRGNLLGNSFDLAARTAEADSHRSYKGHSDLRCGTFA